MVSIGFVFEMSKTSNLRRMAHRPRPANCVALVAKGPEQLIRMIPDHVKLRAVVARTGGTTGFEINICHSLLLLGNLLWGTVGWLPPHAYPLSMLFDSLFQILGHEDAASGMLRIAATAVTAPPAVSMLPP